MSSDDASRVEIARLLARLAHRFADREAILWRSGYDEASWTTLEAEATRRMLADADRGENGGIIAFARALLEARAALIFASDGTGEDNATTLPRGSRGSASGPHTFADPETTTSEGTSPFVVPADAAEAFQKDVEDPASTTPRPNFGTTMNSYVAPTEKRRR